MKGFNIAIDGPAGAGKSTIAREAARRLGMVYVDTGAMYRTIALYLLRNDVDISDGQAVAAACGQISISLDYEKGEQRIFLNGEDVSSAIRSEKVSKAASAASTYLPVRRKLVEIQQQLAREQDVIMDGRDIGTCVLPDAQVKIYLTASSQVRAMRRFKEMREKGEDITLEKVQQDITERDYRDMHRENSPLKQAEDAVRIDSSQMTLEQVVQAVVQLAGEKGFQEGAWNER